MVVNKVYATPWGDDEPSEADVTELIRSRVAIHNNNESVRILNLPYTIDVIVHHRHFEPVPLGQAQVFLLRRLIEDAENDGGEVALAPGVERCRRAMDERHTGTLARQVGGGRPAHDQGTAIGHHAARHQL